MGSFRRAGWAAGAMAGLLAVVMTTPASARVGVPPPPTPLPHTPPTVEPVPEWVLAPCAAGAITTYGVRRRADGNAGLSMSGWIQPCAGLTPTDFLLIAYTADLGLPHLRSYQSLSEPTAVTITDAYLSGTLTGICVASDTHIRLACLKVDPGGPGELPVVAPTPTGDPRVLVPIGPVIRETDPTCGTCV